MDIELMIILLESWFLKFIIDQFWNFCFPVICIDLRIRSDLFSAFWILSLMDFSTTTACSFIFPSALLKQGKRIWNGYAYLSLMFIPIFVFVFVFVSVFVFVWLKLFCSPEFLWQSLYSDRALSSASCQLPPLFVFFSIVFLSWISFVLLSSTFCIYFLDFSIYFLDLSIYFYL